MEEKRCLVVCVCVCVCVLACWVVHANLRGGAHGRGLHRGPGLLYRLRGVRGGSLGPVVGQPGVGLIKACLLNTMTYQDILRQAHAKAWHVREHEA